MPGTAQQRVLATQTGTGTAITLRQRGAICKPGIPEADRRIQGNVSMSRRANAWDNAPMESFFKTLKVERIYQVRCETRAEARLEIVDWIEGYYNRERLHTAIGFLTPVDFEAALIAT